MLQPPFFHLFFHTIFTRTLKWVIALDATQQYIYNNKYASEHVHFYEKKKELQMSVTNMQQ
jgi:hypothetical protein